MLPVIAFTSIHRLGSAFASRSSKSNPAFPAGIASSCGSRRRIITVPPPGGFIGKREPETILKTEERDICLELGREQKLRRQINLLLWRQALFSAKRNDPFRNL
jgi:hypothetical protein